LAKTPLRISGTFPEYFALFGRMESSKINVPKSSLKGLDKTAKVHYHTVRRQTVEVLL
jgi:hypothetical protein